MQLVFQKKGITVKFYPIYTSISFVCLFSDKLILFHMVFFVSAAQNYHGAGLASAMRTDLEATYEQTILQNLLVTKKWFDFII